MFTRRPNTTLVHQRGVATIAEFIDHLDNSSAVTPPIGDVVVGTHAGSKGFLTIPISRSQTGPSDYEGFHDSIGAGSGSVEIPDPLIGYTAGAAVTNSFHIKGCNVGRDRTDTTRTPAAPFLVKIKEALGDHVNVSAPKHFHGLDPAGGVGIFEYMAYEFKLGVTPTVGPRRRLVGFADKPTALTAFQTGGFLYTDGTGVPNTVWDSLIPTDITRTRNESIRVPLGTTIGTRQTMNVRRQFRVDTDDVLWTLRYPSGTPVPSTAAAQTAALRADIPNDPRFVATHAFPQYERLGFTSFNAFFAGYLWRFTVTGRDLVCTGTRFLYTVLVPIVNRTTGNVIFNFYPDAGSSVAPILNGLAVTDPQYFAVV